MKSTSLESLELINTTKTKQKHFRVILKVLHEKGECTSIDIMNNCELTQHQISRRTGEMVKLGLIEENGKRLVQGRKGNFTIYKISE